MHTPTTASPLAVGMANCVGGSSVHFGAQYWRFLETDFELRSSTIKRYGSGALPAGATIRDWPVSYHELEPYYDKVEWQLGVSGKGGSNPFEAPRSRGYPMPALRPAGYPVLMGDVMKKMGYHPFPQPAAINSVEYKGRPRVHVLRVLRRRLRLLEQLQVEHARDLDRRGREHRPPRDPDRQPRHEDPHGLPRRGHRRELPERERASRSSSPRAS